MNDVREWAQAHGITPAHLRLWGVRREPDGLRVPVRTVTGLWMFDLVRRFSATPRYGIEPAGAKRGFTLFGLSRQFGAIHREGVAVLVEGFSDALACHAHGLPNAVALLGSHPTRVQLALARLAAHRTVVWFDGDGAGYAAAQRLAASDDQDLRVVVVDGLDPAEFCAGGGDAAAVVDRVLDANQRLLVLSQALSLRASVALADSSR